MTTVEQEAKTDEYVAKTLARTPQLTPDQRQRLTRERRPGRAVLTNDAWRTEQPEGERWCHRWFPDRDLMRR